MSKLTQGEDGLMRCTWASAAPEFPDYHDTEWGFPEGNDFCLFENLCLETVKLAVNFLCNSYFHLHERQNAVMTEMVDAVSTLTDRSRAAAEWLLQFLAGGALAAASADPSSAELLYLRPFLVECTKREVRLNFASLLRNAVRSFERHNGDTETDHINRVLSALVGFIEKDVPNNSKHCGQFFWLLSKFAQMVSLSLLSKCTDFIKNCVSGCEAVPPAVPA